jgi:hypothetical protein
MGVGMAQAFPKKTCLLTAGLVQGDVRLALEPTLAIPFRFPVADGDDDALLHGLSLAQGSIPKGIDLPRA